MVYIDFILLEDLFMNYLILIGTSFLLKRIIRFKRLFLSALIGLLPIALLPLNISKSLIIVINFLISIVMSIIAYNYKNIIYTIKNIFYVHLVSIFLAGSIYLIKTTFQIFTNSYLTNTIILFIISPIVTYIYLKSINNLKLNHSNYYQIDIYIKDEPKLTITAYLDTGNFLIDPYSHKPIILVSNKYIDATNLKTILVPYNTIDNHAFLKCFKPEKIYIEKVGYKKHLLIGLVDNLTIEGADGILNKKLLEEY